MQSYKDFDNGISPAWCPGCGNFGILDAFKKALFELKLDPHEITLVSGIGQSSKMPHYLKCNGFNGLHGRSLPVATGVSVANHKQKVIVFGGDGDTYGEGGNHLLHAFRRNPNITLFVHNNEVYGLTKGQASPTTEFGRHTKAQPFGALSEPLNPLALAIAMDCSFVARSFSGRLDHLKEIMKMAIMHEGFALVDILQICVSFNKVNSFDWYKNRIYEFSADYELNDKLKAFEKSQEFGDKIPLGVFYSNSRPTFEKNMPVIRDNTLVSMQNFPDIKSLIC
ncbi:2-oxoacid:ferredoxin oxidoreductase subunit beta [Thermodesulfobium sp. 4217-1]|uniref:2-oxoacid:ferredoxin oxidoreductase subunit beta n=1 Tax=Thermodesulfobium sp. 4217-1 TaxID=3120013 RepID=UPI003221F43F